MTSKNTSTPFAASACNPLFHSLKTAPNNEFRSHSNNLDSSSYPIQLQQNTNNLQHKQSKCFEYVSLSLEFKEILVTTTSPNITTRTASVIIFCFNFLCFGWHVKERCPNGVEKFK